MQPIQVAHPFSAIFETEIATNIELPYAGDGPGSWRRLGTIASSLVDPGPQRGFPRWKVPGPSLRDHRLLRTGSCRHLIESPECQIGSNIMGWLKGCRSQAGWCRLVRHLAGMCRSYGTFWYKRQTDGDLHGASYEPRTRITSDEKCSARNS
jgi:hypothetical protein